jgi:predicted RNase H-like nuclease (RuvC/YqgF family)
VRGNVEDSFKLLEERIHRAAQRLKDLSAETQALRAEVAQAKARADKAERALAEAAGRPGREAEDAKKAEALAAEVKALRREREEIRDRIEKLVGLMESLTD